MAETNEVDDAPGAKVDVGAMYEAGIFGDSAEDPDAVKRKGLPLQLQRLPVSKLREVLQALAVLKETGVSNVSNVGQLSESLGKAAMEWQSETAYQETSNWCKTPSMWLAAGKRYGNPFLASNDSPIANCSLDGLPDAEQQKRRRAVPERNLVDREKVRDWVGKLPPKVQERMVIDRYGNIPEMSKDQSLEDYVSLDDMVSTDNALPSCIETQTNDGNESRKVPQFLRFFLAQVQAGKEIEKMAQMGAIPEPPCKLGGGRSCLFEFTPSSRSEPKALPKRLAKTHPPPDIPKRATPAGSGQTVISVHVGGAGCGMGVAMWQRLAAERESGAKVTNRVHFRETSGGKFVARAVFADSNSAGLADARGEGDMFDAEDIVEGDTLGGVSNDMSNNMSNEMSNDNVVTNNMSNNNEVNTNGNFAGLSETSALAQATMERVRKQLEGCEKASTILLTHSTIGGIGSGVTDCLMKLMNSEFGKVPIWTFSLLPSGDAGGPKEGYSNTVRSLPGLLDCAQLTTLLDNQALHTICSRKTYGLGIVEPKFSHYNALIARVLTSATAPMRFCPNVPDSLMIDPRKLCTNLVPYPRIHFTVPVLAPLASAEMADHLSTDPLEVAKKALNRRNCLSSVDLYSGKILAAGVYGRGMELKSLVTAISARKCERECQVVDFCPTAFSVACHGDSSMEACGFFNTSAVGSYFGAIGGQFDSYSDDIFSGLSDEDRKNLEGARQELAALEKDFEDMMVETAEEDGEENEEYGVCEL